MGIPKCSESLKMISDTGRKSQTMGCQEVEFSPERGCGEVHGSWEVKSGKGRKALTVGSLWTSPCGRDLTECCVEQLITLNEVMIQSPGGLCGKATQCCMEQLCVHMNVFGNMGV